MPPPNNHLASVRSESQRNLKCSAEQIGTAYQSNELMERCSADFNLDFAFGACESYLAPPLVYQGPLS
jgi:hypothetical protein